MSDRELHENVRVAMARLGAVQVAFNAVFAAEAPEVSSRTLSAALRDQLAAFHAQHPEAAANIVCLACSPHPAHANGACDWCACG